MLLNSTHPFNCWGWLESRDVSCDVGSFSLPKVRSLVHQGQLCTRRSRTVRQASCWCRRRQLKNSQAEIHQIQDPESVIPHHPILFLCQASMSSEPDGKKSHVNGFQGVHPQIVPPEVPRRSLLHTHLTGSSCYPKCMVGLQCPSLFYHQPQLWFAKL